MGINSPAFRARRLPKGNEGKTQGGLPLGNPVCLWQTELFKLNLKSSPSSSGYNRRRRLATRSSGKQQAERTAVRTAPIVCPEESPLARPQVHNFCRRGLTRRLRRGSMAAVILWGSFAHLRGPKVSKGERREAGIQWIQPPKAVSDRSFRQTTSGAHGSANRADCLPRGKPFGAPAGAKPFFLPRD